MALCKNHHWVMDKRLIAPGPDMQWHVSKRLDDRIEGQVEKLTGRPAGHHSGSERFGNPGRRGLRALPTARQNGGKFRAQ